MAAGLQNVIEADDVGFDICVRIGDGVAHTSLGRQVHNNLGFVGFENLCNDGFVSNAALNKCEGRIGRQLLQPFILQPHIVIIIHIVNADDSHALNIVKQSLYQIAAYKAGSTGDQNRFAF